MAGRYQLLPHGASVGRGFGPVVVSRQPMDAAALAGARGGIPGLTTTAWLVLRLIQPAAIPVEIPIVPFARIFDALAAGEVDAALLIHEGRLLYRDRGLHKVVDLGEWWLAEAGLPLHRFPLEQIGEAHAAVEAGIVGKVLVDVNTM